MERGQFGTFHAGERCLYKQKMHVVWIPHGGQCARASHRRERNCGNQFRVVGKAQSVVGIGPGKVEDEFAQRVGFLVERQGSAQPAIVVSCQMAGLPACPVSDTTGLFHGAQILMAQEGMAAGIQCVPLRGVDFVESGMNTDVQGHGRTLA